MDLFVPLGAGQGSIVARAAPKVGFEVAASMDPVACFVVNTAVADLDGDGFDEVVAAGSCADTPSSMPIHVYGQRPEGFGLLQQTGGDDGPVIELADIAIADANGDGILDIISPSLDTLFVLPGLGDRQFETPGAYWPHDYGAQVRRLVPLVRPTDETTMFVVSEAQSTGMAGLLEQDEPGVLTTTDVELQGRIVGSGDFDGDGRLDVVVIDGAKNPDDMFVGTVGIWLSGG